MLLRIFTFSVMACFFVCGCDQQMSAAPNVPISTQLDDYGPKSLDIVGISELNAPSGDDTTAKLTLFVRAMDDFGSAIKTPCVFRVEMYEHVSRSPSPVGKRLEIWPDIDITDICRNNAQWRDYLRAYEFNFDVNSHLTPGHVYIVEVTCLSPMGKRMSAKHNLNYP